MWFNYSQTAASIWNNLNFRICSLPTDFYSQKNGKTNPEKGKTAKQISNKSTLCYNWLYRSSLFHDMFVPSGDSNSLNGYKCDRPKLGGTRNFLTFWSSFVIDIDIKRDFIVIICHYEITMHINVCWNNASVISDSVLSALISPDFPV